MRVGFFQKAIVSGEVVDIFAAAGLKKPDISILSDQFLAEILKQSVRRYQNRAIESALVIEELFSLAREMRAATAPSSARWSSASSASTPTRPTSRRERPRPCWSRRRCCRRSGRRPDTAMRTAGD